MRLGHRWKGRHADVAHLDPKYGTQNLDPKYGTQNEVPEMTEWSLPTEILSPCCGDLLDLDDLICMTCGQKTLREGWRLMYWYTTSRTKKGA